jgi:biopolymer transport protein ExbD
MKLSRHKPPSSLAFNMTPMIDIVFLLIIFFMTVSQITRTVDFPLPLPRVTEGDQNSITSSITINLDLAGTLIIGGQKLSLANTLNAIENQLKKSDNNPKRIKIQIRCDRNCESRHVTKLLESLARLGFTNVRSAVAD